MRITVRDLAEMKRSGQRIAMVTAYDYPLARLLDEAGIPIVLVGDSLGMTALGYETTLPVTLEEMIHHTRAVVRGTQRAMVVADMPFLTYQVSSEEAVRNAGRLIQEGGAQAVKLEGGRSIIEQVRKIVDAGIPVMGHLGLLPQSVHQMGGFRVQARTRDQIQRLIEDALMLQEVGIFSLVLEGIPAPVARVVTELLEIPTIGIGAGPHCDGQVQVIADLLHLLPGPLPRHSKPFLEAGELIRDALARYAEAVRSGEFPTMAESFQLPKDFDTTWLDDLARQFAEQARRLSEQDDARRRAD
ncbi:3-methyl-2-oxobutanoate hydroxymethyltransferase [bacterium HR26]|nr:3-methyl-2-oxobutanoate hydroxymethyltransferase [bacterium HR26]